MAEYKLLQCYHSQFFWQKLSVNVAKILYVDNEIHDWRSERENVPLCKRANDKLNLTRRHFVSDIYAYPHYSCFTFFVYLRAKIW